MFPGVAATAAIEQESSASRHQNYTPDGPGRQTVAQAQVVGLVQVPGMQTVAQVPGMFAHTYATSQGPLTFPVVPADAAHWRFDHYTPALQRFKPRLEILEETLRRGKQIHGELEFLNHQIAAAPAK